MDIIDYRKFKLSSLNGEFSYLKLLTFWPVYGLAFLFVERFYDPPVWHEIYCPVDDMIPFCELFVIPYMFWLIFLAGMIIYTLLYDVDGFKKMMWFIMLTYTVTIIIYLVYPNVQYLRPDEFERDNLLTRFMAGFYEYDTNTNVCPSIHVIGSFAAMFAAWHTKRFSTPVYRTIFAVCAVLISISTVFLKQHSVIDVIMAVPLCIVAYIVCYKLIPSKNKTKKGSKPNEKIYA